MNESKRSLRLLGQFSVFIGLAVLIYVVWNNRLDIQQIREQTLLIIVACSNICIGSLFIQRSK